MIMPLVKTLIFSLTDDINRLLEQQRTDFDRSSYNTRNNMSRCRGILQGTWRRQLPFGWSVAGEWYVLGSATATGTWHLMCIKRPVLFLVLSYLRLEGIEWWKYKLALYYMGTEFSAAFVKKQRGVIWGWLQPSVVGRRADPRWGVPICAGGARPWRHAPGRQCPVRWGRAAPGFPHI